MGRKYFFRDDIVPNRWESSDMLEAPELEAQIGANVAQEIQNDDEFARDKIIIYSIYIQKKTETRPKKARS